MEVFERVGKADRDVAWFQIVRVRFNGIHESPGELADDIDGQCNDLEAVVHGLADKRYEYRLSPALVSDIDFATVLILDDMRINRDWTGLGIETLLAGIVL